MRLNLFKLSNNITLQIINELTKFRLTLSVVFSSFISYILGSELINFIDLTYLLTGGILIVSSSNIFNQIIERDLDKLMNRTKNRPLPKNKIKINTALLLAITTGVLGIILMYLINIKVAILAVILKNYVIKSKIFSSKSKSYAWSKIPVEELQVQLRTFDQSIQLLRILPQF